MKTDKVRERLKKLVRAEMEIQGRKQSFIANRCGYDPKTFSEILNGYRVLRAQDIDNICTGMRVPPNVVFGWDEVDPCATEVSA